MLPIPIIIMLSSSGFCILTCCLDIVRDFSLGEDKIRKSPYDIILGKCLFCYGKEDDRRERLNREIEMRRIPSLSSINE